MNCRKFLTASLLAAGIASPAIAIERVLDFDTDALGNNIVAGQIIDDEYAAWGINIVVDNADRTPLGTINPNKDFGVAFDTQNTTGGDGDLVTPGPGLDNDTPLGNVLIIQENGRPDSSGDFLDGRWDPDDEGSRPGGTFDFLFDEIQAAGSIDFLDIEQGGERGGSVNFYLGNTELTAEQRTIADLGNNSFQTIGFDGFEYDRVLVRLAGSGALTQLTAVSDDPEPSTEGVIPEPVTGTLALLGMTALAMRVTTRRTRQS